MIKLKFYRFIKKETPFTKYGFPLIHLVEKKIERTFRMQEQIDELTLLLLYLTSFEEKTVLGETTARSWKGYPFETLDNLTNKDLLFSSNKSKSVYLTENGMKLAKKLMEKYNYLRQIK